MTEKPTLLILAAGMGSRYGGIKQLDEFGPNGETIIDYSLYDAIKAGFGRIVFIVRKDIKEAARELFEPKLAGRIEVDFALQELDSFVPKELGAVERSKPWGTAHAVLCAKDHIKTPFAVINADDFYGYDAFEKSAHFLSTNPDPNTHAVVGYRLENTLSDFGTVSRGVCEANAQGELVDINERTKVGRENGSIYYQDNEGNKVELAPSTPVSMNFWAFKPTIFDQSLKLFEAYARENMNSPKAEFFIPIVVSHITANGPGKVKVFESDAKWFGVTYQEDKPVVKESLRKLIAEGKYPEKLWA
ncbi:nucleotidyltransferase-like protein [Anseongella ginsenosidimutans]|uniref:Nucleotidyltransferase-like protein n=1 Tax=Anseongella ginsenosidimutans TaxID=496056 RepID=A0A4R3KTG0_9SPHI|nr:sugar phosphate nucleotidyltransferase [Anseongella ginsenosidimutans]QEC53407.1 nucleotidyltransferase [Anseongella ginsenosidimutans]TCS88297.1 nucleotidyltransferase-like protein [Anseongella ginsenosidimutans]